MSLSGHRVACPGHLIPGTRQVTDRLADHQPGVIGHPPQDLPPGIHLPKQADVAGENSDRELPSLEQSNARSRPETLVPSVPWNGSLTPRARPQGPGQPGSARHAAAQARSS